VPEITTNGTKSDSPAWANSLLGEGEERGLKIKQGDREGEKDGQLTGVTVRHESKIHLGAFWGKTGMISGGGGQQKMPRNTRPRKERKRRRGAVARFMCCSRGRAGRDGLNVWVIKTHVNTTRQDANAGGERVLSFTLGKAVPYRKKENSLF